MVYSDRDQFVQDFFVDSGDRQHILFGRRSPDIGHPNSTFPNVRPFGGQSHWS
jgi:hypothetical protein